MLRDLLQGALFLVPIGAGAGLLAILGRDRTANEHDLSDYHEPEPVAEAGPRQAARPVEPAPVDPGTPVHDELAARIYVPLDDQAVRDLAAEWLRDLGQRARAQLQPTA